MKLLLTSAGITNETLSSSLCELIGRHPKDIKIGVIPTAANVEEGDKEWFVNETFTSLRNFGYGLIDYADIAANGLDWKARLETMDAILVSGGNTFYLLDQMRKSGFDKWLPGVLNQKVYIGISAGSIVTGSSIDVATIEPADPNIPNISDLTGLNLVDFLVEPHCDGARFATMQKWAGTDGRPLFALDDQSAVKVDGSKVEVITEGDWKRYN